MYLKIMGRENVADANPCKTFALYAHVASAEFLREDGKSIARTLFDDGDIEDFDVPGNAYVLNEGGNTIAAYGPARAA